MDEKILGIDFGVANSIACVYMDGKPTVIPNGYSNLFPNIVAFSDDGSVIIGDIAKKLHISNPENVITNINRKIGTDYKVNIQGKSFTPQEIYAFVLNSIKSVTETFLGEKISEAVIAVPAYFDDNQRTATKDAAIIAGFNVKKIINSPVAACLAYGIGNIRKTRQKILVFDFGAGTLDVTIIKFENGIFRVMATGGDTNLGGTDMDNILSHYLIKEFEKQHGVKLNLNNRQIRNMLIDAAKIVRIKLSNSTKTEVNLPYIMVDSNNNPLNLITTITRNQLEDLVQPILNRCEDIIQIALDNAMLKPKDIDNIIFVGETTKMPIVQHYVENLFGKKVENEIDPVLCVAQGTSILAYFEKENSINSDSFIIDLISSSLGFELPDGTTSVIFKRNTHIPCMKTEIYNLDDNQTSFKINIVQGEYLIAKDNIQLGSFVLNGIQPVPNCVSKIKITYEIDSNGIFKLTARDLSTKVEQPITFELPLIGSLRKL